MCLEDKVLIVLGMHRSGTSLTTNWLYDCGLDVGDNLYGASEYNKKGYYEDVSFLNLHKRILKELGLDEGGHENVFDFVLNKNQEEAIESLIRLKKNKNQWGWKEPRTSLLVEYYKKILPNAIFLVVYRDYEEVVSSLIKRERKGILKQSGILGRVKKYYNIYKWSNHYAEIWLHYNTKLLNAFNPKEDSVIYTHYNDLIFKDELVFNQLSQFGLKLNFIPFNSVYDSSMMTKKSSFKVRVSFINKRRIAYTLKLLKSRSI